MSPKKDSPRATSTSAAKAKIINRPDHASEREAKPLFAPGEGDAACGVRDF